MKDLKREIAEAICELNLWRVPLRLNGHLQNNGDEGITLAMKILTNFVTTEEWIKVWREQYGNKKPDGPDTFTFFDRIDEKQKFSTCVAEAKGK